MGTSTKIDIILIAGWIDFESRKISSNCEKITSDFVRVAMKGRLGQDGA